MTGRPLLFAASSVLALAASACTPVIGDGCNGSLDCSINNERACDTTVRRGQCTIFNCEPDSCPDNAACVRFRSGASQFTACMRGCEQSANCRVADGFRCAFPDPIDAARAFVDDDGDGMASDGEARLEAVVADEDPASTGFCTGTLAPVFDDT